MIRQPSPASTLYAWHRAAIAGDAPPVHDGLAECGWYRTRLVKGGPWVAVEIKVSRDIDMETGELAGPERLICICGGERRNAASLWTYLTPITRDAHQDLIRRSASIPAMAATMVAVDLTQEIMVP